MSRTDDEFAVASAGPDKAFGTADDVRHEESPIPVESCEDDYFEQELSAVDQVNESDAVTVRTIDLGDCQVTVESKRQIDDYELLEMLWQAAHQLEVEMD